ncbi:hypothetical protein [Ornithinimicrobium panacihumi]|uniref:hypothetical protein n=1 Tax=Ornithinimicrobium panacihumi TaxID=2008449 RepID=UPI003F8B6695
MQKMLQAAKDWVFASPRNAGTTAVVAALLVTVPFGGLAAVEEEDLPQRPVGEAVEFAPWTITLEKAIVGPDLGEGFLTIEGRQHILILGHLTTTADVTETMSVGELRNSFYVSAEDVELADFAGNPLSPGGTPPPEGTPTSGGTLPTTGTVHTLDPTVETLLSVPPGLGYDIGIHLTTTDPVPEQLRVDLWTKTHRQSSIEDTMLWTDEVPSATVMVPTERSGPVVDPLAEEP